MTGCAPGVVLIEVPRARVLVISPFNKPVLAMQAIK